MEQELNLQKKLHELIPGGAHTYSRGDDQFPYNAPKILKRGKGAYVYDLNDKEILDYGMGLRSVNLGYGNLEVADRVYKEALDGNNLTRASLTELEAAQTLVDMIPSVDMVKFAKHGSTVTTAAIKIARAYTGKKFIVVPFEHPFFSFDDWFIGTTPLEMGVLKENSNYTLKFHYNDIDSLKELFSKHANDIACVLMEPATTVGPCMNCKPSANCGNCGQSNFLQLVQTLCNENKALFILDEMITGFRWHLKGAQTFFNVEPDLCTFGKAMANGFAVAALGGKRKYMELGNIINEGQERLFLTSTTHGAEMSGLGAFLETMKILKRDNVIEHFWRFGTDLIEGFNAISKELDLLDYIYMEGYPCSPNYITKNKKGETSLKYRTFFAEKMMDKNILFPYIAISAAHGDKELKLTLEALKYSLTEYKKVLEIGDEFEMKSTVIKPVFRKFN